MLIGYVGRMGSGKTLSMVKYAYEKYKKGYTIYSNIKLNFPYKPYTLTDLLEYANNSTNFNNSIIIMDEAHIFLDSRNSGSKRSRMISYILLMSRKRNMHVIYTTQRFHQIDKRLRENSEHINLCSFKKHKRTGIEYIRNIIITYLEVGQTMRAIVFKAKPYYKLYDSYEVVKNLE